MHKEDCDGKEDGCSAEMKHVLPWILIVAVFVPARAAEPGKRIVVDGSGAGDVQTITEALQLVPPANTEHVLILIRKGTYREKLFLTSSHVSLVGEDRDSTRIVFAELRSNWVRDHAGSDWGSAVVNIQDGVHDVVIANLTIHNNYGSLYGSHDHQFAIRGFSATRIALLYCNVIADGGDTVSLWDSTSGMYYHAFCYFEGWVDYVCPRGWCYITNSRFFGHNRPSASLWHDGSKSKSQKFVIRNSYFDGVKGFPLGRHHKDAQIYLLDCTFSNAMADRPFYSPKSPNTVPWIWGARHYFNDCRREGGNYAWFADNLEEAEGSPTQAEITAKWTFDGAWDPENTLPAVLPFASIPQPRMNDRAVPASDGRLHWIAGRDAQSHRVYFGPSDPPPFVSSTTTPMYEVSLKPETEYYWRIDEVTSSGTIQGDTWNFSTGSSDHDHSEKGL